MSVCVCVCVRVYYVFELVYNDIGLNDVSCIAINVLCYQLISRKTRDFLPLLQHSKSMYIGYYDVTNQPSHYNVRRIKLL